MRFLLLGLSVLLPALATAQRKPTAPPVVSPLPIGVTEQEKAKPLPNPIAELKTSKGTILIELFVDEAPATIAVLFGLAHGTLGFKDQKTGEIVKRPYYDGLVFHRIIPNFMIQGGCPDGTGGGTPGFELEDEINAKSLGLDKIKITSPEAIKAMMLRSRQEFSQRVVRPICDKMGIKSQEDFDKRRTDVQAAIDKYTLYDAFVAQGYKYDETRKSHKLDIGTLAMANHGPNTNGSQFFVNLVDNDYLNGKHTVFGKVVKGMEIVSLLGGVPTGAQNCPIEPVKILSLRVIEHKDRIPVAKERIVKSKPTPKPTPPPTTDKKR